MRTVRIKGCYLADNNPQHATTLCHFSLISQRFLSAEVVSKALVQQRLSARWNGLFDANAYPSSSGGSGYAVCLCLCPLACASAFKL